MVFLFIFAMFVMLERKPSRRRESYFLISMKLIDSVDSLFESRFHHRYHKDTKTTTMANADVAARFESAPIRHSCDRSVVVKSRAMTGLMIERLQRRQLK